MKGYIISYGYMGLVGKTWMLFATETEYQEYIKEKRKNETRRNFR
jgi:hypothetical protein